MFDRLKKDYWLYGRNLFDRCLWAMALYRFGQWAAEHRSASVRRAAGKVYGLAFKLSPILTGVFLDRSTRIGERFHIVHPGMVVIHPGAVFGDDCGVMHGVTVGENMGAAGVPRFGNGVFIGAHATVIGPVTIGDGARIAANSLVFCDVPAGALAMGVPAKIYPGMAKMKTPPADAVSPPPATLKSTGFRTTTAQPSSAGQFRSTTAVGRSPSTASAAG